MHPDCHVHRRQNCSGMFHLEVSRPWGEKRSKSCSVKLSVIYEKYIPGRCVLMSDKRLYDSRVVYTANINSMVTHTPIPVQILHSFRKGHSIRNYPMKIRPIRTASQSEMSRTSPQCSHMSRQDLWWTGYTCSFLERLTNPSIGQTRGEVMKLFPS